MIEDRSVLIFLVLFFSVEVFFSIVSLFTVTVLRRFKVLLFLHKWRKILQIIFFLLFTIVLVFRYEFLVRLFRGIASNRTVLSGSVGSIIAGVLLLFVLCFILEFLVTLLSRFKEMYDELSVHATEFTKVQKKDMPCEKMKISRSLYILVDIFIYFWDKCCIMPMAVFTNSKRNIWINFYRINEERHALIKKVFLYAFVAVVCFMCVVAKKDENLLILTGGLFFLIILYGIFFVISVFWGKDNFLKRAKIWQFYCFLDAICALVLLVAPIGIDELFRWYFVVGTVILVLQGEYQVMVNKLKKRLIEFYPNDFLDN